MIVHSKQQLQLATTLLIVFETIIAAGASSLHISVCSIYSFMLAMHYGSKSEKSTELAGQETQLRCVVQ